MKSLYIFTDKDKDLNKIRFFKEHGVTTVFKTVASAYIPLADAIYITLHSYRKKDFFVAMLPFFHKEDWHKVVINFEGTEHTFCSASEFWNSPLFKGYKAHKQQWAEYFKDLEASTEVTRLRAEYNITQSLEEISNYLSEYAWHYQIRPTLLRENSEDDLLVTHRDIHGKQIKNSSRRTTDIIKMFNDYIVVKYYMDIKEIADIRRSAGDLLTEVDHLGDFIVDDDELDLEELYGDVDMLSDIFYHQHSI